MCFETVVKDLTTAIDEELEKLSTSKPIRLKGLKRANDFFSCPTLDKLSGDGVCVVNDTEYSVSMETYNQIVMISGLESIEESHISEVTIFKDQASIMKQIKQEFVGLKENELHKELFSKEKLDNGEPCDIEGLNEAQNTSVAKALSNKSMFVVGPAGTGKTKTIVATVLKFLEQGMRVLISSHANLAVEGALEALLRQRGFEPGSLVSSIKSDSTLLKEYSVQKITAEKAAFLEDEKQELDLVMNGLLSKRRLLQAKLEPTDKAVMSNNLSLSNIKRDINQEQKVLMSLQKETQSIRTRIKKLESNKLIALLSNGSVKSDLEVQLRIFETKVTEQEKRVKKLVAQELDYSKKTYQLADDYKAAKNECDSVDENIKLVKTRLKEIRDEMEQIISADLYKDAKVVGSTLMSVAMNSKLKESKFDVIIVDEVSMANVPTLFLAMQAATKKVILYGDPMQLSPVARTKELKTSIFDILEITDSFISGELHPKCAFLDTQYRCHPDIAQLTSKLFYGSMLKNGRKVETSKKAMYIKNTHGLGASFRPENGSFINEAHQKVVIAYVKNALKSGQRSIGVISPFKAQANAIQAIFEAELETEYPDADFKAATIHSFQGQEKDVVIFDMTFGNSFGGRGNLPRMLIGDLATDAAFLLNVATTRAKDFFVLVCDLQLTHDKIKELPNHKNMILENWLQEIESLAFDQKKQESAA